MCVIDINRDRETKVSERKRNIIWKIDEHIFRINSLFHRVNEIWISEIFWLFTKNVECSPMSQETGVQSQVESYQSLKKSYLMPPYLTLSIIRYGSRVKCGGKKQHPPLYFRVVANEKGAFGWISGGLRVAFD